MNFKLTCSSRMGGCTIENLEQVVRQVHSELTSPASAGDLVNDILEIAEHLGLPVSSDLAMSWVS